MRRDYRHAASPACEAGDATLCMAEKNGAIIQFSYVYRTHDTGVFVHVVGDSPNVVGVSQLLYWESMRHLKERGYSWADLGAGATGEREDGIFQFKQRLGAAHVETGREYRLNNKVWDMAFALKRLLRNR